MEGNPGLRTETSHSSPPKYSTAKSHAISLLVLSIPLYERVLSVGCFVSKISLLKTVFWYMFVSVFLHFLIAISFKINYWVYIWSISSRKVVNNANTNKQCLKLSKISKKFLDSQQPQYYSEQFFFDLKFIKRKKIWQPSSPISLLTDSFKLYSVYLMAIFVSSFKLPS